MEKFSSLQTGYHRRRALSKIRRRRRQRRRAAGIACAVSVAALLLTLASPSFRQRNAPFTDGKAQAKSFDDGVWESSSATLPFIRHTKKGWVLSDPAPYETITVCAIDQRRFRCLAKEKEAYSAEL